MASDLSEQLTRLGHKAELLVTRYSLLKADNATLKEQLDSLTAEVRSLRAENERLRIDNEYLRISSAIAPDTESALQARAVLTDLVRDIDACVADLMKEI